MSDGVTDAFALFMWYKQIFNRSCLNNVVKFLSSRKFRRCAKLFNLRYLTSPLLDFGSVTTYLEG